MNWVALCASSAHPNVLGGAWGHVQCRGQANEGIPPHLVRCVLGPGNLGLMVLIGGCVSVGGLRCCDEDVPTSLGGVSLF